MPHDWAPAPDAIAFAAAAGLAPAVIAAEAAKFRDYWIATPVPAAARSTGRRHGKTGSAVLPNSNPDDRPGGARKRRAIRWQIGEKTETPMNQAAPASQARQAKQSMQTTNIDIRELVFERLTLLFGPLAPETAHALAEEYARVLKRFPRETLRHAVDCLAETHKYRRWPSVAELVTACRDARPQYATVPPARIADRRLLVAQTLRSKLGQQALKAGYGHSVRLFVEDHGRPPNPAQFQQMAAASKRAQRMAEKELVTGTGATARLKAMWQAMGAREDALRREYLA